MIKCTIPDPSIQFKPSAQLVDFLKCLDLKQSDELPENLLHIYRAITSKDDCDYKIVRNVTPLTEYNDTEKELLKNMCADSEQILSFEEQLESFISPVFDADNIETISSEDKSKTSDQKEKNEHSKLLLNLNDLKWINQYLINRRKATGSGEYLHELLKNCQLILPKNAYIERNPELEKRCERYRREQEDQCYRAMTRNVDLSQAHIPNDSIAFQRKFKFIFKFA